MKLFSSCSCCFRDVRVAIAAVLSNAVMPPPYVLMPLDAPEELVGLWDEMQAKMTIKVHQLFASYPAPPKSAVVNAALDCELLIWCHLVPSGTWPRAISERHCSSLIPSFSHTPPCPPVFGPGLPQLSAWVLRPSLAVFTLDAVYLFMHLY